MKLQKLQERELRLAASQVREALLASLPEHQDRSDLFGEEFERKIRNLQQQYSKEQIVRQRRRRIAAAMLILLTGVSLALTFSPKVRANIGAWFKESFGNYARYWFQGETGDVMPRYAPTWIPEGYEKVMDECGISANVLVYQRGDDVTDGFAIMYGWAEEGTYWMVGSWDENCQVKTVYVHGNLADMYISTVETEPHILFWVDEETNIAFSVEGYLDPQDILTIAESIKLVN